MVRLRHIIQRLIIPRAILLPHLYLRLRLLNQQIIWPPETEHSSWLYLEHWCIAVWRIDISIYLPVSSAAVFVKIRISLRDHIDPQWQLTLFVFSVCRFIWIESYRWKASYDIRCLFQQFNSTQSKSFRRIERNIDDKAQVPTRTFLFWFHNRERSWCSI